LVFPLSYLQEESNNFLAAIANPKHEQHEEMLEWVGGGFDPEAFDIVAVNKKLASVR
jgi:hypothetical protein